MIKNLLASIELLGITLIQLLKVPLKVPGIVVGRLFSLPKSADAVVGDKICKSKRNQIDPPPHTHTYIYIYIYIFNIYII